MNSVSSEPAESSLESSPLGFIGLGLLGSALAERALAEGWSVLGFDINSERGAALARGGGRVAHSVLEVARVCRHIFMVLPHDGVAREVVREIVSELRPGVILLDVTTGDPDSAVALGRDLAGRGVTYLDATLSGSSEQARRGAALFLVGGPRNAFDECRDCLCRLAGHAHHTGSAGSGAKMKLVTNLVLGLNRAALAEGLVLASTLGLEGSATLEILKASTAYSRIMDTKGEKMLQREFEPQARLSQHLKDVRLMLGAAAKAGQSLPLSETHRDLLEEAERLGLGALDNSAILRAIEFRRAGEEVP